MINSLIRWFTVEPIISLLMTITAFVIFGSILTKNKPALDKFWPWVLRFIQASLNTALFLGLLWAFRGILNDNIQTFNSTHGSLSNTSLASAYTIWGRPHIQYELSVDHYNKDQHVPQNSMIGFDGNVSIEINEREKGYALYSGYIIDADFNYQIKNDSDLETEAYFIFPLSPGQTLYNDFKITVDGKDISSELRFSGDNVKWELIMKPQQEISIDIVYQSRGMDYFYYQITTQREIRDFELVLTVDKLPTTLVNYPEGIITPSHMEPTADKKGSILSWELDRSITTAGMGVALLQPDQPGSKVLRVLWNSPYALTLLGTMLGLTLIILGRPIHFLDIALLSAAYTTQFLIMAGLSDSSLGFWGSLVVGALITGTMTYLLYKKISFTLLRNSLYLLVAFFTVGYPLSGLLEDTIQRNNFDTLVNVGLIIYLFSLSLYSRVQEMEQITE